jgi:hypothetical protein
VRTHVRSSYGMRVRERAGNQHTYVRDLDSLASLVLFFCE